MSSWAMEFWCFRGANCVRNHAHQGALYALAMQAAIAEVNRTPGGLGYPNLEMGIGVTTGEAVVGNVGSNSGQSMGRSAAP